MSSTRRKASASAGYDDSTLPVPFKKRKLSGLVKYYAVRAGHAPGVYTEWKECEQNITGFKNAAFKSFGTLTEAQDFVAGRKSSQPTSGVPSEPTRYYAVARGRMPGIYTDWDDAQLQIVGWKGPKYKKFATRAEAEEFMQSAGEGGSNLLPLTAGAGSFGEVSNGFGSTRPSKPAKLGSTNTIRNQKDGSVLHIYTDGSSLSNGRSGAVAGVGVYFGDNDARNISERLQGDRQTNQRAELTAILRALEVAPQHREVHIYSDSKYSIDCVTVWHKNWEKNNWLTTLGKPVENKDLIQGILAKINDRQSYGSVTQFNWVKGHSSDPNNVAADRLAVLGAQQKKA